MGKKQHQKDKMYLTSTEWSTLYGGKKTGKFLDQFTQLGEFDIEQRLPPIGNIVGFIHDDEDNVENTDRRAYTLKRLVRGLASSNRCSRIGFSDALCEVLRRVDYDEHEVLQLTDEWLPLNSKEDKSQMMIGRILAWAALIRAPKIEENLSKCVDELLKLAEKPFLESAVCALFREIISNTDKSQFTSVVWPLFQKFFDHRIDSTPFSVYLLLTVREKYPKLADQTKISLESNSLASVLHMSTSSLPQIHPVVGAMLRNAEAKDEIDKLWDEVIVRLADSPSVEKHFLLLHILKTAFTTYTSLDVIMKEVYVEQLVYPLVKTNSPLNTQVKILIATLEDLHESKSKQILKFILSHNKGYRFDHMTKSNLIHRTLLKAKPEVVQWFAKKLQRKLKELQRQDNDETHWKYDTIILEQLANLTHMSSMHSQPAFKKSICEFLADNYFSSDPRISKKPNTQAFLKALSPANTSKALAEAADNISTVLNIYIHMENRHASFKHEKKLRAATKVVGKLENSSRDADSKLALRIFVGYLALCYALNIQQDVTVLDDVMTAAKAFIAGFNEDDEVEWIDLVMEALVSALSVENSHFRSMILMTFALIQKDITREALGILLAVFKGDEELQEDLTQLEEMSSDDGDSDDDDDESDLDDENIVACEDKSTNDESGSEFDFGDAAFRNQLSSVLGVDGSDDDNEVQATDEDMLKLDKAIAAAFGARFKNLSSSTNKENKKKELQALHFEMKCLHILGAYVKSPSFPMSHAILICKTLIDFATSKRAKNIHRPIVGHIAETLRDISSLKVSLLKNDTQTDDLKELGQLIAEKIKTVYDAELRVCFNSLLPFVVKCIKIVGDDDEWYFGLYRELIKTYLENHSTPVSPPLFVRFMEVFNEHSLVIVDALQAGLNTCMEKRDKRIQMMGLLVAALKLCNTSNVNKKKLKKVLHELASTVRDVLKRDQELAFTMNLYIELIDVMRLISLKCKEADLGDPINGEEKYLKKIFEDLSTKNMPSQIKRRLNAVYRHFFPGEQFTLLKKKKLVHENDDQEQGTRKKRKLDGAVFQNGTGHATKEDELEDQNGHLEYGEENEETETSI